MNARSWRLTLGAAALVGIAQLAAAPALAPFTATYEVKHGSKRIGESSFSLRAGAEQGYVLESRTEPKGIAKLFVGSIVETSLFEVGKKGLRPLRFAAEESRGKGSQSVTFDWERGIAHSQRDGERVDLELRPRTLDHSLIQIALMRDLQHGKALRPYLIVEKNELRTYQYEQLAEETVETPAGSFRAVKVRQHRAGSSRELWFWFAPELGFLAVRVEQRKNGTPQFTMSLTATPGAPGG